MKEDSIPLLPHDTDVAVAARQAAGAFGKIASTLLAASQRGETRSLVSILTSGRSLGPGECMVLADLISGKLCKPAGRATNKAQDKKLDRDILARCRELMDRYERDEGSSRGKRPEVIRQVASDFQRTETQVAAIWKNASGKGNAATITRAQLDDWAVNDPARAASEMARVREGKAKLVD